MKLLTIIFLIISLMGCTTININQLKDEPVKITNIETITQTKYDTERRIGFIAGVMISSLYWMIGGATIAYLEGNK